MNKKLVWTSAGILSTILILSIFLLAPTKATENSWISKAPMPTARAGLGVAAVGGKIYAIGGQNANGFLKINEVYDPAKNTWETKAPMPTARSGVAITVYQNKIYVIGGLKKTDAENSEFTGITEVYDPVRDSWETKATMPTPRADLSANVVGDRIYLIGGKNQWQFEPFYHELNINEVYNPVNNSWTTKEPIPVPVFGYASAVVGETIYIMGGARQFQATWDLAIIGSNQAYNTTADAWRSLATLPIGISHAGAGSTNGVTAPKRAYVLGGYVSTQYSNITQVYDFEQNSWTTGATMLTSRGYFGVAVADDVLYAIGGNDGKNWLNTNEQYMPIQYGTVPPKLSILSPENKTYNYNNIELVLDVNRPINWISYSLDGQSNHTIKGDITLAELSEGAHHIIVYVNDTFGNIVSSNTVYFAVDTLPPKIQVLSPENSTYGSTDIQTIFEVDEPVLWMAYSLDGEENTTVTGNFTLAVLSNGNHRLRIYAEDLVGNQGASETIYFTIAPFPTLIVVASAVIITIIIAAGYLVLKRKKILPKRIQRS